MHIPKSAGTSIRNALFKALPQEFCLEWNATDPFDLTGSIESLHDVLLHRPKTRLISGHFPYGVHAVLGNKCYKYFTTIRNPVDRVISNFRHAAVHNLHLLPEAEAALLLENGFQQYFESPYAQITLRNAQARLVSGLLKNAQLYAYDLDRFTIYVKNIIERDYIYIDVTQNLKYLTNFLNNFYLLDNNKLQINFDNIGENVLSVDVLLQTDLEKIIKGNSYECAILKHLLKYDCSEMKSNLKDKDKSNFFSKTSVDAALNMARLLRQL